jgi:hypothetical protein
LAHIAHFIGRAASYNKGSPIACPKGDALRAIFGPIPARGSGGAMDNRIIKPAALGQE